MLDGATKQQCDKVGGSLLKRTQYLLHVWVVPGYESPEGVYAHLSSTITCDDGSYRTIKDVTKPVTWAVTTTLTADALSGSATTAVKMSDYGIGPIEIPMLATEDKVKLALDFVAVPAAE